MKRSRAGTRHQAAGGCAQCQAIARLRLRAYTLVELIIVIAVLGIAGAMLVPNMVNRDSMNVQAAVRLIIGDLSFAQSDALAHQQLRRVHFYQDGRGYCIVRLSQATELMQPFDESETNHDYILDPLARGGTLQHYIADFNTDTRFRGVSITSVSIDGGNRDLQYDALGGTVMAGGSSGVPGTGGSIVVASGDEQYRISIAPFTGKLTVVKL